MPLYDSNLSMEGLETLVSNLSNAQQAFNAQVLYQLGLILAALDATAPPPPPPPPPPPSDPSAASVAYVASQISVYAGCVGTYANLTDENGATGAVCNGEPRTWIKASYDVPVIVTAVRVGGGTIPAAGLIVATGGLNAAKLQYSTDDANWTDALAITGVTDSGADQFKTFTLATPITARYWRLESQSYLATTEFKLT